MVQILKDKQRLNVNTGGLRSHRSEETHIVLLLDKKKSIYHIHKKLANSLCFAVPHPPHTNIIIEKQDESFSQQHREAETLSHTKTNTHTFGNAFSSGAKY